MCGAGVGFSVEKKYTRNLPSVVDEFHNTETVIMVRDSKLGWAKAFREIVTLLYAGKSQGGMYLTCDPGEQDLTLSAELGTLHLSSTSSTSPLKPLLKRKADN